MLLKRSQMGLCALMFALNGAAAGCGDDSEGKTSENGDGDSDGSGTRYTASVTDSSSDMAIRDLKVHVLDNATGMKTGQVATTDLQGRITLEDVKVDASGRFAVLVEGTQGEAGYMDTFQYNLDPNAQNDILRVVGTGAIAIATAAANFKADPAAGPISGAIFTGTGASDRKAADCLKIELAGFEDAPVKTGEACTAEDLCIRYFFDQRIPDFAATHTSSANGRFYVANAPAGEHTINVKANGETIASTRLVVIPRNQGTTGETISVANIYLGAGNTNPLAGTCK